MPIQNMWQWLEKEFPQRMNAYKIIFSPLIGGSHSTQRFYNGFFQNPDYEECIMFVNSPSSLDEESEYSEQLKEGLMSGIVFTEIDHNYVNPTSKKNRGSIKTLIQNKDFWATAKAQNNYGSEYAIFNEYMTHSLFCLYVKENYPTKIAEQIIENRVQLMNRRGFIRFQSFNDRLLEFTANRTQKIVESYADIIELMKGI